MGCSAPQTRTAVVPLPAEIDVTTVRQAGKELIAAFGPGITTVIADMTATAFCDCSGVSMLDLVRQLAIVNQAELVLVVQSAAVLRTLSLCGLDLLLPVYPSLATALTAQATPQAQDSERAADWVVVHQQPAQARWSRMKAGRTADLCPPTGEQAGARHRPGRTAGRLVLSRKGSRRDELQPSAWPGIPRDAVAGIGTRLLGRRPRHPA